jgi:hypothetical protein
VKVEFGQATLECEAAFRHLSAIMWMFVDGRHKWIVPDLDAVRRSRWLEAEGSSFRRNTIEYAEKAARSLEQAEVRVLPTGESGLLTPTHWELSSSCAGSGCGRSCSSPMPTNCFTSARFASAEAQS